MILHRRKDLAPKQTIFQKSACQHRFFGLKGEVLLSLEDLGNILLAVLHSPLCILAQPLNPVQTYLLAGSSAKDH